MKWLFIPILMTISIATRAQGAPEEFLERFHRAFDYTAAVAEAMPGEAYHFTPVDSVFTFAEQINHAIKTVARHTEYYYVGALSKDINERYASEGLTKSQIMERIERTRRDVDAVLRSMPASDWDEKTIAFFSGDFSTGHFFQILLDHMTHHRGMAITYLRMQGIKPPQYVGW